MSVNTSPSQTRRDIPEVLAVLSFVRRKLRWTTKRLDLKIKQNKGIQKTIKENRSPLLKSSLLSLVISFRDYYLFVYFYITFILGFLLMQNCSGFVFESIVKSYVLSLDFFVLLLKSLFIDLSCLSLKKIVQL